MKILLFSDIHNSQKSFQKLKSFLEKEFFDLGIFAGDFTYGWKEDSSFVKEILNFFKDKKIKLFGIPGNNDKQDILDLLKEFGVSIHLNMQKFKGFEFYGLGGWGNPEEYKVKNFTSYKINSKTIFISHIPPKFKLVQKAKILPLVHIYGHSHFRAQSKIIRNCLFVQVPSILNSRIAILKLPEKKVEFVNI